MWLLDIQPWFAEREASAIKYHAFALVPYSALMICNKHIQYKRGLRAYVTGL